MKSTAWVEANDKFCIFQWNFYPSSHVDQVKVLYLLKAVRIYPATHVQSNVNTPLLLADITTNNFASLNLNRIIQAYHLQGGAKATFTRLIKPDKDVAHLHFYHTASHRNRDVSRQMGACVRASQESRRRASGVGLIRWRQLPANDRNPRGARSLLNGYMQSPEYTDFEAQGAKELRFGRKMLRSTIWMQLWYTHDTFRLVLLCIGLCFAVCSLDSWEDHQIFLCIFNTPSAITNLNAKCGVWPNSMGSGQNHHVY